VHWIAIVILFLYCMQLDAETQKLRCKANGLEWGVNTRSFGVHCKSPERGG
jgi:hypothetical protein